ncbi:MAG: hypothetical protein ACRCTQ_01145 [Brevinemataceae bacterium]
MITITDYNRQIIREFTNSQFASHIQMIEDIKSENDFGTTGINIIIENYLHLVRQMETEFKNNQKKEFSFSREQVVLYDIIVELARLCYKHSYHTISQNDWENEFDERA